MVMEENEKQFISDEIGDDYKTWEAGKKVLITAPTGSGKTTFVFDKLLERVVKEKATMLYLVNRKVLKARLQKDIRKYDGKYKVNGMPGQQRKHVIFMTYQQLEEDIQNEIHIAGIYNCKYIVCDEAHYFIADSNFNTNTFLSYEFITKRFPTAITVLISATLDAMIEFMPEIEVIQNNKMYYGNMIVDGLRNELVSRRFWEGVSCYTLPKDYSYLNVQVFQTFEEMISRIGESKKDENWLIFYNNIPAGKSLVICLQKLGLDAVFIDADYEKDEGAQREVKQIVEDSKTKSTVVCSTSLLDNGVNLKQRSLRNLVIIAENEVEFIQMLGRKRRDDKNLNVYICMRTAEEFNQRLFYLNRCREFLENSSILIRNRQYAKLMEEILSSAEMYADIRKFLFFRNVETSFVSGSIDKYLQVEVNPFAQYSIANQCLFYEEQIENMKKNPSAFLDTQLKWLGMSKENICKNKKEAMETAKEKCRQDIEQSLYSWVGREYPKDEITDMWNDLCDLFKAYFTYDYSLKALDHESNFVYEYENHKLEVGKKRGVSINRFREIMSLMEIPLYLTTDDAIDPETGKKVKMFKIVRIG